MKPLLLKPHEVIAFLAGRKTLLARPVKYMPDSEFDGPTWYHPAVVRKGMLTDGPRKFGIYGDDWGIVCPFGGPGDKRWCQETWRLTGGGTWFGICYRADEEGLGVFPGTYKRLGLDSLGRKHVDKERWQSVFANGACRWRPGTQMPREFSRLTLEVTSVAVKRLQDVTEDEAEALGIDDAYLVKNRLPGDARRYAFQHHQWNADFGKESPFVDNGHIWLGEVRVQEKGD